MRIGRPQRLGLKRLPRMRVLVNTALALLIVGSVASAADHEKSRLVVMLYPENSDGNAGNALVDQGLRSTFAAGSPERIEIYNEYLDIARSGGAERQQLQAELLRQKFADRKVDLVLAGLSTSLDFALKYRQQIFPGVPIIFLAVESAKSRRASCRRM